MTTMQDSCTHHEPTHVASDMRANQQDNLARWLAIYHAPGIGPATFNRLLQQDSTLLTIPDKLKPNWHAAQLALDWRAHNRDAHIITVCDAEYPALLRQLSTPPPILYVLGDVRYLHLPQIAMVGTRNPTTSGLQLAQGFAKGLAECGLGVTSGLALGIDGACHRGALEHEQGFTVAVLGHGLDQIYPRHHAKLAEAIVQRGCLVSEFSFASRPERSNFPRRNRLISGLSLGVVVVEATESSGSLITARYALEQGREIFAIPGPIYNAQSRGSHALIRQGAKLVERVGDILEELQPLLQEMIRDKQLQDKSTVMGMTTGRELTTREQKLLLAVDYEATCVDMIVARTGLAIGEVSVILLELELRGIVKLVPGGYVRNLSA